MYNLDVHALHLVITFKMQLLPSHFFINTSSLFLQLDPWLSLRVPAHQCPSPTPPSAASWSALAWLRPKAALKFVTGTSCTLKTLTPCKSPLTFLLIHHAMLLFLSQLALLQGRVDMQQCWASEICSEFVLNAANLFVKVWFVFCHSHVSSTSNPLSFPSLY